MGGGEKKRKKEKQTTSNPQNSEILTVRSWDLANCTNTGQTVCRSWSGQVWKYCCFEKSGCVRLYKRYVLIFGSWEGEKHHFAK